MIFSHFKLGFFTCPQRPLQRNAAVVIESSNLINQSTDQPNQPIFFLTWLNSEPDPPQRFLSTTQQIFAW